MVFLCGAEFWTPRVGRGIKGSGPHLTFDLKRALSNLKMKTEKLELECRHPETPAIYTHTLTLSPSHPPLWRIDLPAVEILFFK